MGVESERHTIEGSKPCGLCLDEMTIQFLAMVEVAPGTSLKEVGQLVLRKVLEEHLRDYHSDKVVPPLQDSPGGEFTFGD